MDGQSKRQDPRTQGQGQLEVGEDLEIINMAWFWPRLVAELMDQKRHRVDGCRLSTTVTLWFDGLHWRGSLHRRDADLVSFVAKDTLEDVLDHYERGLVTSSLPWRPTAGR